MITIFDITETFEVSQQKDLLNGGHMMIDSAVHYRPAWDESFVKYSKVRAASLISDPANPIDKDWVVEASEIVARYNLPSNPASGYGRIELIYIEDDPINNPYNLVGFSIEIEGGEKVIYTEMYKEPQGVSIIF